MQLKKLQFVWRSGAGFTLIELIVALAAFGFLAVGVVALTSNVLLSTDTQGRGLANLDQARKISFEIVSGLRTAGYGADGAYPLQTLSAQSLEYFSNLDGDLESEKVRYFVQNSDLYRGITQPTGSPATYDPAGEQIMLVLKDLNNGVSPIFYYYDGSFEGEGYGNPLTEPVLTADVRYVEIQFGIKKDYTKNSTGNYTVLAGASVRNLKSNLNE